MEKISRFEYKFFINRKEAELLALRFNKCFKKDPFSPYEVLSIYFDTFRNSSLIEKLSGDARRKKLRLRTYHGTSKLTYKFEIKEKYWGKINKISWKISKNFAGKILEAYYSFDNIIKVQNSSQREILQELLGQTPVTGVYYKRRAWLWPFVHLRLTLDEELSSFGNFNSFLNKEKPLLKKLLPSNKVILEIKFNSLFPKAYLSLFQDIPKVYSAISKFVYSRLDQLDIPF